MITIKTKEQIKIIREGGIILAEVLENLKRAVKPGVNTGELENLACRMIARAGGRPSFKGYRGSENDEPYPTALCASINNEIVHAPSLPPRVLNTGDIVGLDIGMEYPVKFKQQGLFTDMAATVPVGPVSKNAKKLIKITRQALEAAIREVGPNKKLSDIGRVVQTTAEAAGFSVVRDLVGHGVGLAVHEDPQVLNYVPRNKNFNDVELRPGMVIAIEPMVNAGGWQVKELADGFTIATADNSLSAHFEHTIAVTENGYEILTGNTR